MEQTLRYMSVKHLEFLLRLIENEHRVGTSESDGQAAMMLSRKGWISPFGKLHGRQIWRLEVEFGSVRGSQYQLGFRHAPNIAGETRRAPT
jgi:hypothetical protein